MSLIQFNENFREDSLNEKDGKRFIIDICLKAHPCSGRRYLMGVLIAIRTLVRRPQWAEVCPSAGPLAGTRQAGPSALDPLQFLRGLTFSSQRRSLAHETALLTTWLI